MPNRTIIIFKLVNNLWMEISEVEYSLYDDYIRALHDHENWIMNNPKETWQEHEKALVEAEESWYDFMNNHKVKMIPIL